MAIFKTARTTITQPDGNTFEFDTVEKTKQDVQGGEHIVRQDIQNGYGIVLETGTQAVSVDRNEFYNKDEISMIEENITEAYETFTEDTITKYETEHVKVVYATKQEVKDLQNEAMTNYTLKDTTNQLWTTSVTTFATKSELDKIAERYGVGIVIKGSIPSADTLVNDSDYSANNPSRFQGETYFTQDYKHLWQFNLINAIAASPQVMIDQVNGFDMELGKTTQFQLWIATEMPDPDELITVKFGIPEGVQVTRVGEETPITELTVKASELAPSAFPKIKLNLTCTLDVGTQYQSFITFTTYAGEEEVPEILTLTMPIRFNGYVPPFQTNTAEELLRAQNLTSDNKISSTSVLSYVEARAKLEGDELIGTTIEGTYGHWLNLGTIVGPANELVEEVLVSTIHRDYVTVAGSQPDMTELKSTAKVLNEYPNQQLELEIVEGLQGAPGVRGYVGNKVLPTLTTELDTNNNREVQILQWNEFDWNNNPIADVVEGGSKYDANNPNAAGVLPEKIRIEGLDAYEVWKDYYLRENGIDESKLTKENFFLDITGDSAFKFWRDVVENSTEENFQAVLESLPGYGIEFDREDIIKYIAFQRGDAYIPQYDAATGVLSFKYVDSANSPETDETHDSALNGWRVRGQVYEPSVDYASGELSFVRKNEESSDTVISGVNIRGNVWVPSVDTESGLLSWTNTRDSNNPADVDQTYVYGPIYEPVITYSTVTKDWDTDTGFESYQEEEETLTWKSVRKPTALQTATNIKGLKGSPVRIELEVVTDVVAYDTIEGEISAPVYTPTSDHIGYNTQTLTLFTPFDRYNLKIHDATGTPWYIGVDTEGRLVTSNTPYTQTGLAAYSLAQEKKIASMRSQIAELQATIQALKDE
jgi:hypothetical protein